MESEEKKEVPLTKDTATEITIPSTKLTVVPNWRRVLRTYSFWAMIASACLVFVESILPFFGVLQPLLSEGVYAGTIFFFNLLAVIARMIKQKSLWEYHPEQEKQDDNKLD